MREFPKTVHEYRVEKHIASCSRIGVLERKASLQLLDIHHARHRLERPAYRRRHGVAAVERHLDLAVGRDADQDVDLGPAAPVLAKEFAEVWNRRFVADEDADVAARFGADPLDVADRLRGEAGGLALVAGVHLHHDTTADLQQVAVRHQHFLEHGHFIHAARIGKLDEGIAAAAGRIALPLGQDGAGEGEAVAAARHPLEHFAVGDDAGAAQHLLAGV